MPVIFVRGNPSLILEIALPLTTCDSVVPGLLALFSISIRSTSLSSLSSQWRSQVCLSLIPFSLIFMSYLWLISSTEHKSNYSFNTDDLQISFPAQDLSFKILAEYHHIAKFSSAAILLTLFVSSALHQALTLSVPWRLIMGYIFPIFLSVSAMSVPTSSWFLVSLCSIYYWLHILQFNFAGS